MELSFTSFSFSTYFIKRLKSPILSQKLLIWFNISTIIIVIRNEVLTYIVRVGMMPHLSSSSSPQVWQMGNVIGVNSCRVVCLIFVVGEHYTVKLIYSSSRYTGTKIVLHDWSVGSGSDKSLDTCFYVFLFVKSHQNAFKYFFFGCRTF